MSLSNLLLIHFCSPLGDNESGLYDLPQTHFPSIQCVLGIEQGHGPPITGVEHVTFEFRASRQRHSDSVPYRMHVTFLILLWMNIVQSSRVLQANLGFGAGGTVGKLVVDSGDCVFSGCVSNATIGGFCVCVSVGKNIFILIKINFCIKWMIYLVH